MPKTNRPPLSPGTSPGTSPGAEPDPLSPGTSPGTETTSPGTSPGTAAAEAPSDRSSRGSAKASSPGSPFITDPGTFAPEEGEDAPPAAAELAAGGPDPFGWQEEQLRDLLRVKGELLHTLLAVERASEEWRMTQGDLDAIAPPLTRILNRYPVTQAAAGAGDAFAVGAGFFNYGLRSIGQRRAYLALRETQKVPVTGYDANGDPVPTIQENR